MFLVELIASSFLDVISKQARPACRCKPVLVCIIKCKQTVYHQNKEEKIRIKTDCYSFFPLYT